MTRVSDIHSQKPWMLVDYNTHGRILKTLSWWRSLATGYQQKQRHIAVFISHNTQTRLTNKQL